MRNIFVIRRPDMKDGAAGIIQLWTTGVKPKIWRLCQRSCTLTSEPARRCQATPVAGRKFYLPPHWIRTFSPAPKRSFRTVIEMATCPETEKLTCSLRKSPDLFSCFRCRPCPMLRMARAPEADRYGRPCDMAFKILLPSKKKKRRCFISGRIRTPFVVASGWLESGTGGSRPWCDPSLWSLPGSLMSEARSRTGAFA